MRPDIDGGMSPVTPSIVPPVIVLFTRDLRVHDHPALAAAVERGHAVLPLFVIDPKIMGRSPNRARFLMESLVDLDASLHARGGNLVLRMGDPAVEIARLAKDAGCDEVWVTRDVSAHAQQREVTLARNGFAPTNFPGHAIVEPGAVTPAGRDHYRVFSPYFRAWSDAQRREIAPVPQRITLPMGVELGPRPDPQSYVPDSPNLMHGGETEARARLERYASGAADDYAELRNVPAAEATSRLSPYLRFGCISANEAADRLASAGDLVRQLAWRDFFAQLLAGDPRLAHEDLRPPLDGWRTDPAGFEAWRTGKTGLPLVDAGMRQLAHEGWMHGRVRMAVGSMLTRRLQIDWREGRRHFDRLLLDGDVANDSGNWQWVAGTGTDARRGRVLNPVRQARRFDPDGAYVRRYVTELADVPAPLIFAPWRDPALLRSSGYPAPIVEVIDR